MSKDSQPEKKARKKMKMPEEAKTLLRALFALDALRVGILRPELRNVHIDLRKIGFLSDTKVSWSYVRHEINEILDSPSKSPQLTSHVRTMPILTIITMVGVGIMIVMAALSIFVLHSQLLFRLIIVPLAVVFTANVLKLKWEDRLRLHYERNLKKTERVKTFNQLIINHLIRILKEKKYPLDKVRFLLYNIDYDSIVIRKKPNFFRDQYIAKPVTP